MEKKERNEEIQSRREFFKKAAKGALPMLGAVLLANAPAIARAADAGSPMGCTGTCTGSCYGSCRGCSTTCTGTCSHGCKGCSTTCTGGCSHYACKGVGKN